MKLGVGYVMMVGEYGYVGKNAREKTRATQRKILFSIGTAEITQFLILVLGLKHYFHVDWI